jgi:hypothetical protein
MEAPAAENMGTDVLGLVCQHLFARSMSEVFLRSNERAEDAPSGKMKCVLWQSQWLSWTAETCKQMHVELKVYRETEVADLIQHVILTAPTEGIELCNIDAYLDAEAIPATSHMLFTVQLGRCQRFAAVFLRRTLAEKVTDDEGRVTEHTLSVWCGLPYGDVKGILAQESFVPLHPLCFVSGSDFTEDDNHEYDMWHGCANYELQECMRQQLAALSAFLVTSPATQTSDTVHP